MLVLKINEGEKIKIGDNVELAFKFNPGQHSIGVVINAPRKVKVVRIAAEKKERH